MGFRNGLEHYLNSPPYKKCIQIATDPASRQSNQMLDAKLKKKLKKPTIECEDLRRLKESDVISLTTPQGLLCLVSCHPVYISVDMHGKGRET